MGRPTLDSLREREERYRRLRLTVRQREVLRAIGDDRHWFRPMDIGGTDGSHHSKTLAQLAKKGLIERDGPYSLSGIRGSYRYRLATEAEEEGP